MPPPIIPVATGDILEVRIRMLYEAQELMNVLHYRVETAPPGGDFKQFAEDLNDQLKTAEGPIGCMEAFWNEGVNNYVNQFQIIHPERRVYVSLGGIGDGLRPADSTQYMSGVDAVIVLQNETLGRGKSGRVHIPGLVADDNSEGYLAETATVLLNELAAALTNVNNITGGGSVTPVIYNRKTPAASTPFVNAYPARTLRVMHKRVVGRGK